MKPLIIVSVFVALVSCPVCFLLTVSLDAATLDCQRVESHAIHCTRTLWTLRIIPYARTAINDLRGAELAKDDCKDGCYYRVGLQSDTIYTLAPVSASWLRDRDAKQALVNQINAFVEDESAISLSMIEGSSVASWLGLILLGGMFIVATLLVILGRQIFWPKRR